MFPSAKHVARRLSGSYVVAVTAHYNVIAARGLDRLAALSDGLFAIAMTLIVLEIRVPDLARPASDGQLAEALVGLAPRFVTYLMSFLTLGIFWSAQQNFRTRKAADL